MLALELAGRPMRDGAGWGRSPETEPDLRSDLYWSTRPEEFGFAPLVDVW
jgi:hypothetical protein